MKILVLFTSQFPYRKGDVFIENEFPFLCAEFEKIYIVTTWKPEKEIRPVPPHVEIIALPYHSSIFLKVFSLLYLLHPLMWKEFYHIRRRYRLGMNPRVIAVLFSAF